MSQGKVLKSGWRREDTEAVHAIYNKCVLAIVGPAVPPPVMIRRLKMLSAWALEAAEEMQRISAEDAGLLVAAKFWAARNAGNRGETE
jgi:hypothetical protein